MSNAKLLEKLNAKLQRTDIPPFVPGDTVRVHVKIKEGDKERLQAFEGSFGQGVVRIFPANSKVIDRIEVVRSSGVRRAKLYYLRKLKGKAARLREVERAEQ